MRLAKGRTWHDRPLPLQNHTAADPCHGGLSACLAHHHHDSPVCRAEEDAVLLLDPHRRHCPHLEAVRGWRDLVSPWHHPDGNRACLRLRCGWRGALRLPVRPQGVASRRVRSLHQGRKRTSARRAGPDLRAVVRAGHLVEGGARLHAGVLHRVFRGLSGRARGFADRSRQCPHARHERAAAHAPCLLACRDDLDVLVASHLRRLRARRGRGRRISRLVCGAWLQDSRGRKRVRCNGRVFRHADPHHLRVDP